MWDDIDWSLLDEAEMPTFDIPEEMTGDWLSDPFMDWGGGAGGDGTDGSGDWGGGLGGLAGLLKGGSGLSGLFGGGGGKGGMDMMSLLSLLGLGGAALNTNNKTNDATKELQAAADKSNAYATDLIGGARQNFAPYIAAGQGAIPQLQAMVGQGLASKFATPISGLTAQAKQDKQGKSGLSGGITLAQLAARKK